MNARTLSTDAFARKAKRAMAAPPPPAPTRAAWPTAGLFQRGQCTVGCAGECSHPATGLEQNLGELEFARSACSAAQAGDEAQLAKLLERSAGAAALRGDGAGGASGFTPLHYAARNGHAGCVALLLRHRAAVDAATSGGATALHRAAFCGHEAIVRALLAARACATLQDADGEAPLHKAAAESHEKVARLLHEAAPAAAALRDRRGRTPAERVPVAAWGWLAEAPA